MQKNFMVSIFEDIFGRHISGTGGQINFFFGKWFYSDKSSIPKNEKKFELGENTKVPILPDSCRQ